MAANGNVAGRGLFDPPPTPDVPTEAAEGLAEEMLDRSDVHRSILEETAASAAEGRLTESGRTACHHGARIFAPAARRSRSVSLRSCRRGTTGIWHTHVSQGELRAASHSLPDMANVIFDEVTASVVVGYETSEAVLEPANGDVAGAAFQDAVGVSVESARETVQALEAGAIANPPAARERVRQALPGLFRRRSTPHPELRQALSIGTIPSYAPGRDDDQGAHADAATPGGPGVRAGGPTADAEKVRDQARDVADVWRGFAGVSPTHIATSYVASTMIQSMIDAVLFD